MTTNSATNSQSSSTNRLSNDITHRDLDGGGISIKCLRKIFKSYGEFTASQPWELIVTTLTGLMLVLIWAGDLGNHVMNTGKAAQGNSGSMLPSTPDGCRSGYKEASSPLINNDEYNGDGTQMEKIIMAFARCLAVVHLLYRFKRIHRIGSTFLMKIAATYLFATFVMFFLVAYTLSGVDTLRYRLLYDSWFLVILFVDLPRVTRMAQFALSSSHHRRISENVSHGMFVLAPTFTLETIAKILLVSFGALTGIPKVEAYAWFAVVLTFVNFVVYMTFFPAALSLILELMYSADGRARWDVRQIIQSLPSEEGYSPAVHKVRIVGTAALIILHVVLRRPITFDLTTSSQNYSTSVYLLYLIGNNFEQLFYIFIMTAMAVKYLFYEDMDEVSELRRTYIEELNRSYEVEKGDDLEDELEDSDILSSSVEEQMQTNLPDTISGNVVTNEIETDEGISVRSISITDGSIAEGMIPVRTQVSKRKHLTSSGTICRVGSDSSSESACSETGMTSDILKPRKNKLSNSDSMSSSDIEQEPHPASSISSRRSSVSIDTPKEIRTVEECKRILSNGDVKTLTDDEILQLLDTKNIRAFELEKVLEDHLRGVEVRRKMIMRQSNFSSPTIKGIPYRNYDYEKVLGQCAENVIGYMTIPLGVVGPLKMNDKFHTVPMATTEGCLIASTNRGCSALRACGVKTLVTDDKMTRAPVVRFESAGRAAEVKRWMEDPLNMAVLKEKFASTSRFAKLKNILIRLESRKLYIRFEAFTGDAMGMNMVSKATEFTLNHLKDEFPDMEVVAISSNMCTDKKPSAINWIAGRGKSVVAEAIVPKEIVERTLKTSAKALVDLNNVKNKTGSAMAGSIGGNNAHAANIVTAIYLATGQDAAQNVCSSMCSTDMEDRNGDLYMTCTMPCIEVGTVGGGTILAAQSSCLEMLGVKGSDSECPGRHAQQLAQIVCATVLAGELSLMSALAAGHLVKSHLRHNRSQAQLPQSHSTPLSTVKEIDMRTSSIDTPSSVLSSSTLCAALLTHENSNFAQVEDSNSGR